MLNPRESLRVELGARSYDIHIGQGLLAQVGALITPEMRGRKVAVVTDETVHALHGAALANALSDYEVTFIIRPAGEAQKSFEGLQAILNALFEAGFDRADMVLAFGGGVVGDLAGFAASIYKRGCPFIQIPTTLLAQVDSSVGGKTAINNRFGKNLIGAFYQPRMVIADMDVLATLPARQMKAGYAEILKYGLLGDAEFYTQLDADDCALGLAVLAGEPAALTLAVERSCAAKAKIVAADEREAGQRALLNLGHTFGHAFELAAGYDGDLLHGEAVSAGMEAAFAYSAANKLCAPEAATDVRVHLDATGMPTLSDMAKYLARPDALLGHMMQDKKNERGALTLILTRAIGEAFVQKDVAQADVLAALKDWKKNYA